MIYLIALGAVVATFLGGLFALRFRDKLHLVLGFSAGAVIAVAFFDLLPEALDLASGTYDIATITSITAAGFLAFMIFDRLIQATGHSHATRNVEEDPHEHGHAHENRGILGAASLSMHSFLDGAAIGLAFQVSSAVGVIVTTAVLVHDFSDGINTVNLILKNKGNAKGAFKWLTIDALTPVAGIVVSQFIHLPEAGLGIVLAVFCGFFLYIGASDLLPESYHRHPTLWTTLSTIVGATILFFAIRLAGA